MAKGALESAGIDAMIQADTAGGMRPHLAWAGSGFNCWFARRTRGRPATYLNPPTKFEISRISSVHAENVS